LTLFRLLSSDRQPHASSVHHNLSRLSAAVTWKLIAIAAAEELNVDADVLERPAATCQVGHDSEADDATS
jgi:hypothetical protein